MKRASIFTFSDLCEQNRLQQEGLGSAFITTEVWNWAVSKFVRGSRASYSSAESAVQAQKISIWLPFGRSGTKTITVTPLGNYIRVQSETGTLGEHRPVSYFSV